MSVRTQSIRVMKCDAWFGDLRCGEEFMASGEYAYHDFVADAEMCGWSMANEVDLCPKHSGGDR